MGNTRKLKRQGARNRTTTQVRPAASGGSRPWIKRALIGGVLAVLFVGVVYIASDVSGNPQTIPDPPPGTEYFTINDSSHVEGTVQYAQSPPAGGPMNATPLRCQAYDAPVPLENTMHSLEHGAAWIAYQPDLAEDEIGTLEGFARRRDVLVSPYPGLDSPVVLTTWGTQLRMDSVDTDTIDQFIRAFQHRTAPENNVGC